MSGAFLMSREIFSHEIWTDVAKFRLFFYIVGNAVFSEKGVTKGDIHIGRGQYLRSYRNIREDLLHIEKNAEKYYSLNTIKKKIDEMVKNGMLTTEETRLGTLFTVVNYQQYQGFERYKKSDSEQQENGKRTVKEQEENGNRTAREQQENNKNYVINAINVNQDTTTSTTASDYGFGEVLQIFEANLCQLSPLQIQSLEFWFEDFNHCQEIIYEAIKIAADRNRKNYGFVEFLLKEWSGNKLTTIEQIQSHERNKFNKPKRQSPRYGRPAREENVPDWFHGRNSKEEKGASTPIDIGREREKLLRELGG